MSEFDLLIIGAGPAGIALAAEARAAGVPAERVMVLEKSEEHSFTIRKFYPESKPVLANYKGMTAQCNGVLCIPDLSRAQTLTYLDRAIAESGVTVHYREEAYRIGNEPDGRLHVDTNKGRYVAKVVVIAIGILGRPNKPSYPVPKDVQPMCSFDVTSEQMTGLDILVVGGGDTATEYAQFLVQQENRVTLSFRAPDLTRPNPINRDSVLALEKLGRLEVLRGSNIKGVKKSGEKAVVEFVEEAQAPLEVDRVIYALGGTTPENFLKAAGIEFEGEAPRLTEGFATSVPGLFLVGDLTAGKKGGSIILAFNSAAAAMRKICDDHGICEITTA